MKEITNEWIKNNHPCSPALEWWDKKERRPLVILDKLITDGRLDWANWFIVRLMTREQQIQYAIFAAEQVIDIYEKKHPGDDRPRKSIEAAKAVLADPFNEKKKKVAAANAADAANDAAYAAYAAANAADAAYAANAAANAAAYAANAAANAADAAYAANAAANAADAAYAAYAANAAANAAADAAAAAAYARREMRIKILNYGIGLIKGN